MEDTAGQQPTMVPKRIVWVSQSTVEDNRLTWPEVNSCISPNDNEKALFLGGFSCFNDDAPFVVPPESSGFSSLLDWALHLARKFRLLKNDKTLLLSPEDVYLKINVMLSRKNKELYGSSETQISDVLDLHRLVRLSKPSSSSSSNGDADDHRTQIVRDYANDLKSNNLVDPFDLAQLLSRARSDPNSDLSLHLGVTQSEPLVCLVDRSWAGQSAIAELLIEALFPEASLERIVAETPLNASLGGEEGLRRDVSAETLPRQELAGVLTGVPDGAAVPDEAASSTTERYCEQWAEGYLRLLVNSRDELALARIVCGPAGFLEKEQRVFALLKKEAEKTRMPIYQTIVSYVNKLKLGGKSYAPNSDHALFDFNKELTDFVDFMDKLQDKVEDEARAEDAAKKILSSLKSQAFKQAATSSAGIKVSSVEKSFQRLTAMLEGLVTGRKSSCSPSSTPKRSVGSGGSMAGRKNVKVLRDFLDHLMTQPRVLNLHTLLGKLDSASNLTEKGTPLAGSSVTQLYKTPPASTPVAGLQEEGKGTKADGEFAVEEASLSDRLGLKDILDNRRPTSNGGQTKQTKSGLPKFGSTLAWAPETSPIVASESPEQQRTFGGESTMVDSSPVSTGVGGVKRVAEIERELDEQLESEKFKKAKLELVNAVEKVKKTRCVMPKRAPKRSILKDIANMKVPSVLQDSEQEGSAKKDQPERPGKKVDEIKRSEISTKPALKSKLIKKAGKKPKKSAPEPLKGQMKMTAFLRM